MEYSFSTLINAIRSIFLLCYLNVRSFFFGIRSLWDQQMNCWEKTYDWCRFFRVKPHISENSKELKPGKIMYLANHRSWADFFVDGTLCGGASYIARYMVCLGVPGMAFTAYIHNYIWLFRRRRNISRQWFTGFFKENWEKRPKDGVIVYPEGHRYTGEGSLPIKTGALEVAYNLQVPCQCVLTLNKESILNEKKLSFNYDIPIYTSVSDVIDPTSCKTKEEWFDLVKETWDKTLKDVHECKHFKECSLPLPGVTKEMTHSYKPNNFRAITVLSIATVIITLIFNFMRS